MARDLRKRSVPAMDTIEHLTRDAAVVRTESLSKRFGSRTAVDSVDLIVPRASAFGFLGPNGAGKTTLIRMLLGLTQPTGGEMHLLGLAVPERGHEALARVGAIVEEPRDAAPAELVRAVRVVATGDALLSPSVTRQLLDRCCRGSERRSLHRPSSSR